MILQTKKTKRQPYIQKETHMQMKTKRTGIRKNVPYIRNKTRSCIRKNKRSYKRKQTTGIQIKNAFYTRKKTHIQAKKKNKVADENKPFMHTEKTVMHTNTNINSMRSKKNEPANEITTSTHTTKNNAFADENKMHPGYEHKTFMQTKQHQPTYEKKNAVDKNISCIRIQNTQTKKKKLMQTKQKLTCME